MTISHPPVALENERLTVARQALAELPAAEDNDRPHFWIGRLSAALTDLVAVASPGGLDNGQREVLGHALADAIEHRTPYGDCVDCDTRPEGLCSDHAADLA
jgi:hypothetical protein